MATRTFRSRPSEANNPRKARTWDWAERQFGALEAMTYFRRSTNKGFQHEYRFQLADGTTVTKAASEIPSLGSMRPAGRP